jgi:acyl-CoA synthetase (AMP-forming)/AMP-acid ligase II
VFVRCQINYGDYDNLLASCSPKGRVHLSAHQTHNTEAELPRLRLHQLLDGKPDDAVAIVDWDGTTYTYVALAQIAEDLSFVLADHGVRAGDRVLIVAENSALFASAIFACSHLNAWAVLVNARQSQTEVRAVEQHSGARTILCTSDVSPNAQAHADALGAVHLADLRCGPIIATPVVETTTELVTDDASQVAALLYTTGTTSAPKGVMLTHGNLLFAAENSTNFNGVRSDDKVLAVLPGTHIYCLSSVFLTAMNAGACVQFVPRFDPAQVLSLLRGGITRLPAVPQMYAAIMAELDRRDEGLNAPDLRNLATGGAPLDPDLKARVQQVFGRPLNNGYGITETSPTVSQTHNDEPRDDCSVGKAMPHVDVIIHNADKDGIGEIWVKGDNVMKGYYRDPILTAATITKDGYFRTGDLGHIDPDGAIHIVGRSKELIIRSGFNVYPPEVEAMLTRHPNVRQAAVIGRKAGSNEEVLAFIIADGQPDEPALQNWLRERLVGYKIPQHIFYVEAFPTAATGKILKHRLQGFFADMIETRDTQVTER